MTATVHTHHALEVTHPHLRNGVALAGDTVFPVWRLLRWAGRHLKRFVVAAVDFVEEHLAGVIAALVALVLVAGVAVVLASAGLHLTAISVFVLGVLTVACRVSYWAGGPS